jgi:hypothetical protein
MKILFGIIFVRWILTKLEGLVVFVALERKLPRLLSTLGAGDSGVDSTGNHFSHAFRGFAELRLGPF